jgi:tripartite-type tricarboxylate transporter receptor subunit TctC
LVCPVNAINATLYEKLNFMFLRDISPVASIATAPLALLVHPSLPARSVPEFIAYAKANPSKTSWGSSLNGSLLHMAGELFKLMAGLDLVIVPYRGTGPMMTDLLGGQVQVTIADLPSCIEHVRSGSLRALAVTTAVRSPTLAAIPTISDFLPGFEVSAWQGIGVPRNTPPDLIERLNQAINAGLASAVFRARLADLEMTALPGSPERFGQLISEDAEKWAKVIRAANIKPD